MEFSDLLTGIAMAFVIEGLIWSLFTAQAKETALSMADLPLSTLRNLGVVVIFVGVVLLWLIRG